MGFWPRRIVCTSGVRPLSSSGYQLNSGGSGRPTLPQRFLDVVILNLLAQQSDECHIKWRHRRDRRRHASAHGPRPVDLSHNLCRYYKQDKHKMPGSSGAAF